MLTLSDADLDRTLTAAADVGARWLRVGIDWSAIEAQPGVLDWSTSDRIVAAAERHGLKPLGIILYTPPWAAVDGVEAGSNKGIPRDPAQFGRFSGLAAQRYATSIQDYEIWNEPNIINFFQPAPNLQAYVSLLKSSYTAIHAAVPGATVVTAGLSPAGDSASSIAPLTFVQGLYDAGAAPYFDAVGLHPYSYPALPTTVVEWNLFKIMDRIHQVMVDKGDANKKIWITEYGAPTGTSSDAVSEDFQAESISTAICTARKNGYVAVTFIYTLRDQGTDPNDREDNFGLLHVDYSPKPSYSAVQRVTLGQ
ncbi:beta-xylosidase [Actinomycetes bacterium M1A6_2h]